MSLKAYKDEFIKHLNIIAINAQQKKDLIISVGEGFGCDSVNKACSHMLNEYKKTYKTAGSSLEQSHSVLQGHNPKSVIVTKRFQLTAVSCGRTLGKEGICSKISSKTFL